MFSCFDLATTKSIVVVVVSTYTLSTTAVSTTALSTIRYLLLLYLLLRYLLLLLSTCEPRGTKIRKNTDTSFFTFVLDAK